MIPLAVALACELVAACARLRSTRETRYDGVGRDARPSDAGLRPVFALAPTPPSVDRLPAPEGERPHERYAHAPMTPVVDSVVPARETESWHTIA